MPRVMVRPQSVTVDTVVYIAERGTVVSYSDMTHTLTTSLNNYNINTGTLLSLN